jgi:nifR3 family TIM-barrel protein
MYKENFQIGDLKLKNNIFYAPLAGCSDFPYRSMGARWNPGLMWCEMVKMEPLVRFDPKTYHLLDFNTSQGVVGAQICGSNPKIAGAAAAIIEELGFPIIDLNCGCPVDKVTKDGSGSGLLKTPEKIGEIISNMVARVKIPVTLKIRAGWDEGEIITPLVTEIAEAAGAKAICIHGRTREQAYRGNANWETIRMAKAQAKNIVVIGNGDLFTPEAVVKMGEETGCDAFLIARGAMGRPWFAEEVRAHVRGEKLEFDFEARVTALKEHFEMIIAYQGDRRALTDMRRVGCWYFSDLPGVKNIRHSIAHANSLDDIRIVLDNLESHLLNA